MKRRHAPGSRPGHADGARDAVWGTGPAVAGLSGQPEGAHGASLGKRALTLAEPQPE